MPNLKDVIKGIECCGTDVSSIPDCSNCYLAGPGFGIECRSKLLHDAYVLLKNLDTIDRMADRDSKQIEDNLKNELEYQQQLNKKINERRMEAEDLMERLMKLLILKAIERHKVDE